MPTTLHSAPNFRMTKILRALFLRLSHRENENMMKVRRNPRAPHLDIQNNQDGADRAQFAITGSLSVIESLTDQTTVDQMGMDGALQTMIQVVNQLLLEAASFKILSWAMTLMSSPACVFPASSNLKIRQRAKKRGRNMECPFS